MMNFLSPLTGTDSGTAQLVGYAEDEGDDDGEAPNMEIDDEEADLLISAQEELDRTGQVVREGLTVPK